MTASTPSGTSSAGTAMTTSSGGSSSSARLRAARIERTTPPARSTGVAKARNPPARTVPRTAPPRLPGALDAPTTASEAGARIGRSEATTPRWSRASMRFSTASSRRMSSATVSSPYAPLRRTSKRARSKTVSIPGFPCITSASKRSIALSRDRRELLQQPRRGAASLEVLRDRERHLGDAGLA